MSAYTFFDSQTWAGFYAYNQILIILTIVIASYFLAKQLRLQYSSYKFENDIRKQLGYVSIAINGLKQKYQFQNDRSKAKLFKRVKDITYEMVMDTIDVKFDDMHELIDNHKQELKNQVTKMFGKERKKEKEKSILNEKVNSFSSSLDENMMVGIQQSDMTSISIDKRADGDDEKKTAQENNSKNSNGENKHDHQTEDTIAIPTTKKKHKQEQKIKKEKRTIHSRQKSKRMFHASPYPCANDNDNKQTQQIATGNNTSK